MRAICLAIEQRTLLSFTYNGLRRLVEPHTHGSDHKLRACLSAYQASGESSSGEVRGWKLFRVADMRDVAQETRRFAGPRPDYQSDDTRFSSIHCRL
jgi:hypothetical protein